MKQIQGLGCEGFAILWDDIEPELSDEDAKHFKSFSDAHCQVELSTTNDISRNVYTSRAR